MKIPLRNTSQFVRSVANQCMSTRQDRANRGAFFESYATIGSSDSSSPAIYNKTAAVLDDLESLLFSPVSLRFHIGDPDIPNIVNEAKGRAAAARLRQKCRQADADSLISQAVGSGLVKGLGLTKSLYKGKLSSHFVKPEEFGVFRENHCALDQDMEAFCHSMLITKYQADRLIAGRPDEAELRTKIYRHMKPMTGSSSEQNGSAMQIVVGGMHPLRPGGAEPNGFRGVVDWMSQPKPSLDPSVAADMIEMTEVWIWNDKTSDWATFQLLGDDILILGRYAIVNSLAYDPATGISSPELRGAHPFSLFCPNPVPGYFWGMSEVAKLILLQESINARLIGVNKMLRKQEDPSTKFIGSTGVNQIALSRFNKPGGYYTDSSPNAKIERDTMAIPPDIWSALREYERMFNDVMGMPPISKGEGEQGVRSGSHAETLVRMFSPRFKDRALLIERNIEAMGSLVLDLCRAHDDKRLWAWVPKEAAGDECGATDEELKFLKPPAPGFVPVLFTFANLPENVKLTVDSHSSSPAFGEDSKKLAFDLLKIGGLSTSDLIERVDVTDPDELLAGITRREAAKAAAEKEKLNIQLQTHAKTPGEKK